MTTAKALELVLELAAGNILDSDMVTDAALKREARKQEQAYEKVSDLLNVLSSTTKQVRNKS